MNSSILMHEQIAEGLSESGYAVVDQFLLTEIVQRIVNHDDFKNGMAHFRKASIGKAERKIVNERIRGDYIQWIDRNTRSPELRNYLDKLNELIQYLNQTLFLSLKDFEVHLTIYPVGSSYTRHIDQFNRDDHRKISIILYLNEGWTAGEGGQLRMHLPDKTVDIFPVSGRLVCFRSDLIEHEVLPATRERLSITGWILDQFAELRHL